MEIALRQEKNSATWFQRAPKNTDCHRLPLTRIAIVPGLPRQKKTCDHWSVSQVRAGEPVFPKVLLRRIPV